MDVDTLTALTTEWLSLPELADRVAIPLPKIKQLVREGKLVTVPHGRPAVASVPAEFVHDGELIRGLAGTVTVLRDAGYRPEEAVRWLLSEDPVLNGRPVEMMAAGRHTAVKRRAQVLAF